MFLIYFSSHCLKRIYNTCAIQLQVIKQASVARILFAGFFGIFTTSINTILLMLRLANIKKNKPSHRMHA